MELFYGDHWIKQIFSVHYTALVEGLYEQIIATILADLFSQIQDQQYPSQVIVFGSGSAIDFAKIIGAFFHILVIAFPTSISTNASMVYKAAIWRDKEKYSVITGACNEIYFDLPFLRSNQSNRYNLAGFGDIISCFTALADWQIARKNHFDYYAIEKHIFPKSVLSAYDSYFFQTEDILKKLIKFSNESPLFISTHRVFFCVKLLEEISSLVACVGEIHSNLAGRIDAGCEHQLAFSLESLLPNTRMFTR